MKSDSVWHRIKLGVKSYWYRLQFGGSILTRCPDTKDVRLRNDEPVVDVNGSELANSSVCLLSMDSSTHKYCKPWIAWAPISGCSWNCSRRRPSQLRTPKVANLFGKEAEGFVIKKRLRRCKIVTASSINQQPERRSVNRQKNLKKNTRTFPSSSSSSSNSSRKSYFPQSLYCLTAYHFCWHEFAFLVDAGFDLNRPQYLHCESTDSGSFVFRFISVLDLFLYVVEKCYLLISKGLPSADNVENIMFDMQMFNNRCAAETVVFPRLLSALLSKGADVRLTSTASYENVVGGLPTSRMRSLSTIAAMELSFVHKANTPVVYNPIDAAGIIRQLIKSGLQPDNITSDLVGSQLSTQDNLYEKLLWTRWFQECLDQDIRKAEDASVDRSLHPHIEVRQQICQRLPENLRRSVAYLEASDIDLVENSPSAISANNQQGGVFTGHQLRITTIDKRVYITCLPYDDATEGPRTQETLLHINQLSEPIIQCRTGSFTFVCICVLWLFVLPRRQSSVTHIAIKTVGSFNNWTHDQETMECSFGFVVF
ncbi:hypothetical protein CLF_104406 [Clonorchis sinensis]|uniref:Uncharacterized protein n=1 Tax=Clonorchis sinensis TaxID=79923 RepID=G7YBL4_CLOSI|nr:hypothetical protein CLF_104406 [Clonorchis sinensis]